MPIKTLRTDWLPEFGRAFVVCSIDNLENGERGGEYFIIRQTIDGQLSVFQQALYAFNLPKDPYSDDGLFNHLVYGAEANINLEVARLLLKASTHDYRRETSRKLLPSSIQELIVAALLQNQRTLLTTIMGDSRSVALSTELTNFLNLSNVYARIEK